MQEMKEIDNSQGMISHTRCVRWFQLIGLYQKNLAFV